MLPRPRTTFTLKQDPREIMVRRSKSPKISDRTAQSVTLKCLSGELVHGVSLRVRKRMHFKDGHRDIYGTLYCTNYRIAFRPDCLHSSRDSFSEALFDNDNDIALPCIDRILAVAGQSKVKVVTPSLSLKFTPEELMIHYRGFRLMHLHISDNGLKTEAYTMTNIMVRNQQQISLATHQRETMVRSLDRQESSAQMDYPTSLFESVADWENEMERLGASAWRVTPLNERCDTCTSLSKYFVIPCKFLDNDLKKTFAHFQQRRIARWSWHHPCGSDLLRTAGFQTNTDPDKEDLKSMRLLFLGNHLQCVVIDTHEDLPSVSEIQISYLKLRGLCSTDTSTPTSEEKWLSNLEGTKWLDYVRLCLKKATEVAILLGERRRSVVLQESEDRDLNCLMASLVQLTLDSHTRTFSGFQSLVQKEWVSAGHPFLQRINHFKRSDKEESPVFLLFLDCVWQFMQQFPSAFEFTESYLMALHDSTYNLFCSTFTHNCHWDRIRGSQRHSSSQTYTPVNGWRDIVREKLLLNGDYKPMEDVKVVPPMVWEWSLFYSHARRKQFQNPVYQVRKHKVLNGNETGHNADKMNFSNDCSVYLLSKGSLVLQSPFFPRKFGTVSKRTGRRAQSTESLLEEEKMFRSNITPYNPTEDLLLPISVGPWVRLWKRCYLRYATDTSQHNTGHPPATSLAEELRILEDRLNNLHTNNQVQSLGVLSHPNVRTPSLNR